MPMTRPVPDMESSLPLSFSAIGQLGHIQQVLVYSFPPLNAPSQTSDASSAP